MALGDFSFSPWENPHGQDRKSRYKPAKRYIRMMTATAMKGVKFGWRKHRDAGGRFSLKAWAREQQKVENTERWFANKHELRQHVQKNVMMMARTRAHGRRLTGKA